MISDMTFEMGLPAVTQTFAPFSNSLGISSVSDSNLHITYNLFYADDTPFDGIAGIVQSFSDATRTITAYTTDTTLPSTNAMKVRIRKIQKTVVEGSFRVQSDCHYRSQLQYLYLILLHASWDNSP
jgi:hypothetical protein